MINYIFSFIAVVKAGGYSNAAKNIGTSKAQLSRHVSNLEKALGAQLLHRTTRSLALTEQGREFYQSSLRIEERYNEAVNSLKHNLNDLQGTLRITAPIDFGIEFLPQIIHRFNHQCNNIKIILELSNTYKDLIEDDYNLAIRIANKLPDSGLRMRVLMTFKRIFCVSPNYAKIHELPKHPRDLKNHTCITSVNKSRETINPQWHFYENNKLKNYPLENVMEVDSLLAQSKLIYLGSGIGRMPNYLVDSEIASGKLIEVFKDIEKPTSYVYLLSPDVKVLPKKTLLFIEFLKNGMQACS